ncbi:30S ribosomal subunit protein S4 [Candidatus Hodgkinia cicadicola Dsem]|nr:30S ribosomal subunit protein S4 [Candidatus Hodgkinia cicadicola Dsem]
MNRRLRPKFKFDRRVGESLWGVSRSSVNRVPTAPGQHGYKTRSSVSEYAIRLTAKQKLKFYYSNLTESKLVKAYKTALKYRGDVAHNLVRVLERRLDVLVYRARLAASFRAARQLISHGHVLVNNSKVDICSFECKPGDVFRVAPCFVNAAVVKEAVLGCERSVPNHISCDFKHLKFTLVKPPAACGALFPVAMCPELVAEYYSGVR